MIYYCVKTEEYLRDILDRVAFGAQYYCVIDMPLAKAEALIEKFNKRYELDQSPRQRTYKLNQKMQSVVDLVVLLNQSLYKLEKVRLCLLCTVPIALRPTALNMTKHILREYGLTKDQQENFIKLDADRKERMIYRSARSNPQHDTGNEVYELVQLPYSAAERKQKLIADDKQTGWTWRLHKNFLVGKQQALEKKFKRAQTLKHNPHLQDQMILGELNQIWRLAGFRGVRQDIFNLNKKVMTLYPRYFNRTYAVRLEVPRYTIKVKRTVKDFTTMVDFHKMHTKK